VNTTVVSSYSGNLRMINVDTLGTDEAPVFVITEQELLKEVVITNDETPNV